MFAVEMLIFLVLCLLCYILFRTKKNYWKLKGVPFENPLPLVGNMLDVVLMKKNMALMLENLYFKFINVPYFGIWVFGEPHLVIRSPEVIKNVLIKDFDHFNDRNVQSNEKIDPIASNMMFFTRNPKWKFIRTTTTPMFSSGKLKYIYPQIQAVAKDMISFIAIRNAKALFVREVAEKYATDVICSIAFGIDSRSFQDGDTPFTNVGKGVFDISLRNTVAAATYFTNNSLVDTFKIKFIETSIGNFISETFMNIVKERQSGNSTRRDLIDLMIKFKKEHNLKDNELVAQAAQFFLAGYETSSSTINHGLYEIALHKDVQDKLRKELEANIQDDGEFPYYTLKNMPYLHQIVLETLRKYPPVPFLGRTCTSDYKIPNTDVVIDKGCAILISLLGLHYDPQYFPEPDRFDPERFSAEDVSKRDTFCYLPFGDGQRNCIGERIGLLSVKMAIAHIVKNFEFEVVKGTPVPLKVSPNTFLLRTDPVYVNFTKIT